jgi:hypothetical protein
MSFFRLLAKYHSESWQTFVLVTGFLAFVSTMAAMVGVAVLFSFFQ